MNPMSPGNQNNDHHRAGGDQQRKHERYRFGPIHRHQFSPSLSEVSHESAPSPRRQVTENNCQVSEVPCPL